MKKLFLVIILLIAIPFCLVVWAGLDAAGGSLINCRLIESDTSLLTLYDNVAIGGNLTVTNNDPQLVINDSEPASEVSFLVFTREYASRAHLKWDEPNSTLIIESVGKIRFGEDVNSVFIDSTSHQMGVGTDYPGGLFGVKSGGTVGTVTFTGLGLDDLTAGGTLTSTVSADIDYKVKIDFDGTPDTFKWSDDGGSTWDATGVSITESAQTLNNGITVTFDGNNGHKIYDYWEFTVTVYNPFYLWDADGNVVMYVGNDGKVGIGTDSPATILDVNGIATIGTLTLADGSITDSGGTIDFGNETLITTSFGRFGTGGVGLYDGNHYLYLRVETVTLDRDRVLLFNVGEAHRTITLSGDPTLDNWFDQSVKVAASPTFGGLTVDSNSIRVTTERTPSSSYDTGTKGEICWDNDYIYVAVANNTWKKGALTLWGLPAENVIYAGENVIYAGEDVVYP